MKPYFPNLSAIINKKNAFHKEFIKTFMKKLKDNDAIASGVKSVKLGHKSVFITEITDWVACISSTATVFIPLAGPFIALSAQSIKTLVDIRCSIVQREHARQTSEWLRNAAIAYVECTIEEVSFELQRIFEYQIGVQKDDKNVEIIARDAAQRILNFGYAHINKKAPKLDFDRDILLRAVIEGKSKSKKELETLLDEEKNPDLWCTEEVFSKPGIRKTDKDGAYYYKSESNGHEKYGFRGELLETAGDGAFRSHFFDKFNSINKIVLDSELFKKMELQHRTIARIVNKIDLKNYADYLQKTNEENKKLKKEGKKKEEILEFNQFIAETYYKDKNVKITAVYRAILTSDFKSTDYSYLILNKGQFQSTDFCRANLRDAHLINANFQNSIMIRADLSRAQAQKLNLGNASLMFGIILKTDLNRANLIQTDLRYVTANESTNLCDVIYIKAEGSTVFLANINSTVNKRLKALAAKVAELENKFNTQSQTLQSNPEVKIPETKISVVIETGKVPTPKETENLNQPHVSVEVEQLNPSIGEGSSSTQQEFEMTQKVHTISTKPDEVTDQKTETHIQETSTEINFTLSPELSNNPNIVPSPPNTIAQNLANSMREVTDLNPLKRKTPDKQETDEQETTTDKEKIGKKLKLEKKDASGDENKSESDKPMTL